MIEMCDLLIRHASDRTALRTDPVVQAAAQRWIEVLGEAAAHVSEEPRPPSQRSRGATLSAPA